jgi:ubiquinone/menaquinone biosynthesis C-methylase UbiE
MSKFFRYFVFKINNSRLSFFTKYFFSSSGYQVLETESIDLSKLETNTWSKGASLRQFKTWNNILLRQPKRSDLNALLKALSLTSSDSLILCEIGCGSAYLSDFVLQHSSKKFRYLGLDSSHYALSHASKSKELIQAYSKSLPLRNNFAHIVLDGAALIHILDWQISLKEYARVSLKYIILHSISISDQNENFYVSKFAYGQRVSEIVFSQNLVLAECTKLNLRVIQRFKGEAYTVGNMFNFPIYSETWLLEKIYE